MTGEDALTLASAAFALGIVLRPTRPVRRTLKAIRRHKPLPRRFIAASYLACTTPTDPRARTPERIALDAHRIGTRFHCPADGTRFVKVEAIRQSYDQVLTEACALLRIQHRLDLLRPGSERDAERSRIEGLLRTAGLDLPTAGRAPWPVAQPAPSR